MLSIKTELRVDRTAFSIMTAMQTIRSVELLLGRIIVLKQIHKIKTVYSFDISASPHGGNKGNIM